MSQGNGLRKRLTMSLLVFAVIAVPVGVVVWAYQSFASTSQVRHVESEATDGIDANSKKIEAVRDTYNKFRVQIVRLETDSEWIKDTLDKMADKQGVHVPPPPVHKAIEAKGETE